MTCTNTSGYAFGTSAACAEASFSCTSVMAVLGTAFAVSLFVMAVLALRLQGLVLAALITIAIIISIIMVRDSAYLSERT